MFIGFDAIGFSGIGEAPEDRWVIGGSAEMLIDWEVRIYSATHEYITRPGDLPADAAFKGTLEKAFRIDRSILGSGRIGEQITIGYGEAKLSNLEGDYDFLSIDHTAIGQRIVLRVGDRRRPYSEWKVVLDGYMTGYTVDRDFITFQIRDAGHQLDVPLSPNTYAGTGGEEGGEDLKDRRKPRAFGWLLNWPATLVIPNYLAYQINDGPIHQVDAVYARGVALTFEDDYPTVADMNAAALAVGEYATCLAKGWIRIGALSESEMGQVTVDFAGDETDGVFVETTADLVRRMLGVTTIADPADLNAASFTTLNAEQSAPVGIGIGAGDDSTVAQVAGRLMAGIGGWLGARRNGKFEVRRFDAPAWPSGGLYTKTNLCDVQVVPMPDDLSPPPWRILVGWGRNWMPGQNDLAGSVSEERRAWLAESVRLASAENNNVRADFPPGHELSKSETFFRDEADAALEAQRLGQLYWPARALYVVKLSERLYVHELGQVVTLQFPRFDLAEGKFGRIVKLSEDDEDGVEMTVFA